ncbi:MAG TPA: asparagine synthase (glutamine-hydrolyzing) [Bryobacteraceae bacterium]|nr:asparagine synthase (glutamine-hydrolyzing) [Bryobacteraceae bacterium]
MCGIAGIISSGASDSTGQQRIMCQMLGMIRHRGPDQFGIYQDPAATLGSARLSIIDLSSGQQPIANEDRSLWIVLNGEIFNYVELRPDLEKRGHRFTTSSDTEVLLHLYEEHGPDCLHLLNGQFAFAIWDARNRRLFLARDRMGIRPLFYTEKNGTFLFASEIKALLAYPGMMAEIDPVTLDQVFTYWSPLPGRTAFQNIRALPPGHFLELRPCGLPEPKRYWSVSFPPEAETATPAEGRRADEYFERFRDLLTDATLIRLRSDVPVGAYLSGGLDSSIITRLVAERAGRRLATFSIAFDDPDFDESEFQLRMARFLGTRHEIVRATHADIARAFPQVIWHTETPTTRTAPAPMFLLSELVRNCGSKVVLTGEGADEVLAGYDIFKEAAIRRFWARRPESALRPLLLRRLYADIPGMAKTSPAFLAAFFRTGLTEVDSPHYSHLVRWRNNARSRRFFSEYVACAAEAARDGEPRLPELFSTWGALQRAQYLESTIFLSEYLLCSQGDRVAMAHSVESRMPFLDYRLVEFCNSLPSNLKLQGLKDKRLLRRMGKECLPDRLWERPKRPYRAPIQRSFFTAPLQDYVRELLSPEEIKSSGLFRPGAVEQLVRKVSTGAAIGETDEMALAGILSTQLLHRQFVSRFTAAPPISEDRDDIKLCRG